VKERPVDPSVEDSPWRTPTEGADEPEPDWAEQIRARRRARADQLREIFDSFDEDDDGKGPPA
jgi:hypothetical protein